MCLEGTTTTSTDVDALPPANEEVVVLQTPSTHTLSKSDVVVVRTSDWTENTSYNRSVVQQSDPTPSAVVVNAVNSRPISSHYKPSQSNHSLKDSGAEDKPKIRVSVNLKKDPSYPSPPHSPSPSRPGSSSGQLPVSSEDGSICQLPSENGKTSSGKKMTSDSESISTLDSIGSSDKENRSHEDDNQVTLRKKKVNFIYF